MTDKDIPGAVQAAVASSASVAVTAGSPTVSFTTHVWWTWGRVAVDNLCQAREARSRAQSGDLGEAITAETDHSLVAICASAFAAEALLIAWAEAVVPTEATKWESRQGKRPAVGRRMSTVLGHSVTDQTRAKALVQLWNVTFDRRGDAVHYVEHLSGSMLHPAGTGTGEFNVIYRLENAEESVTLLFDTLTLVVTCPKQAVREWVRRFAPLIEDLRKGS
jgi:hypothetical protein